MKKDPRVLLSWEINPGYAPPIKFSENQITVCREQKYHDHFFEGYEEEISAWTPVGGYDLFELIVDDGIDPNFDLVVVWASSARSYLGFYNHPKNLDKFNCPILLILGDTHHMDEPISTMLNYANSEPFTHIISIYNRQHLHFFSGLKYKPKLGWFPGLSVTHHEKSFQATRDLTISSLGNSGPAHVYRNQVTNLLEYKKYAHITGTHDSLNSAKIYSNSLISLNVALNGDLNLRNFEIMSAGGFLLADILSVESGQNKVFTPGTNMEVYSNLFDLKNKIDYFLRYPNQALEIAKNGHSYFYKNLQPKFIKEKLLHWIYTGEISETHDVSKEILVALEATVPPGSNVERARKYEALQEMVRKAPLLKIGLAESLSPIRFLDVMDLDSRCTFYIKETDQLKKDLIAKYKLHARVNITSKDLNSLDYLYS